MAASGPDDTSRMVRSVRHGGSGSLVNTAVGVAAAVVIGRTLGPDLYGLYVATHAVVLLVELLASMQLRAQIARDDDPLTIAASRWVAWTSGGVTSLLFLAIGVALILGNGPPERGGLILLLAGHALLAPMTTVLRGVLVSQEDAVGAGLLPSVGGVVRLLLILLLVTFPTSQRVYVIGAIDTLVSLLVFVVLARRAGELPVVRPTRTACIRLVRTAGSLLMVTAAWSIVRRSDLILLDWLSTTKDVSSYSVGLRLTEVPMQLEAATLILAIPRLRSAVDGEAVRRGFADTTRLILPLILPPIVLVSIAGGDIAEFVFGVGFRLPANVYLLLGIGSLALVASGPTGPYLVAHARDRELVVRAAVTIAVNLAMNVLLIPRFGATGAAIATAISLTWLSASGLVLARRHAGVPPLGLAHARWVATNLVVHAVIVLIVVGLIDHPVAGFTIAGSTSLAASMLMNRPAFRSLITDRRGAIAEE